MLFSLLSNYLCGNGESYQFLNPWELRDVQHGEIIFKSYNLLSSNLQWVILDDLKINAECNRLNFLVSMCSFHSDFFVLISRKMSSLSTHNKNSNNNIKHTASDNNCNQKHKAEKFKLFTCTWEIARHKKLMKRNMTLSDNWMKFEQTSVSKFNTTTNYSDKITISWCD